MDKLGLIVVLSVMVVLLLLACFVIPNTQNSQAVDTEFIVRYLLLRR